MLRAAAKNHEHITVVVDHADYDTVLAALEGGEVPAAMRRELAIKAFSHTARYDTAISQYLRAHSGVARRMGRTRCCAAGASISRCATARTRISAPRSIGPRSPWRARSRTRSRSKARSCRSTTSSTQTPRYQAVKAFEAAACVIVKHASPCGIATASSPAHGVSARLSHRPYVGVRRRDRLQPRARPAGGGSDRGATVRRGHHRARGRQGGARRAREKAGHPRARGRLARSLRGARA